MISYRFRWNISFTGGVTSCALSGVTWQFCRRPVTKVTQLASYFIISGTPRNRSGLLSDERFLTRNVIRDRPRYRLVQVGLMTTINCGLAIRRLFVGLDWISWLNGPVGVVNCNVRFGGRSSLERNCGWHCLNS